MLFNPAISRSDRRFRIVSNQAESKGIAFGGDFVPQAVHLSYECAFVQCGCAPIISDFGRALMTYPKKDKA